MRFVVVGAGAPGVVATIVTAPNPTPAARLAALELRYHVFKITGVRLPIQGDDVSCAGNVILVGESALTCRMGLDAAQFESQEYLIRITPRQVVLMGRDCADTREIQSEAGIDTNYTQLQDTRTRVSFGKAAGEVLAGELDGANLLVPGPYDEQGTCYAVYDFLERFCDVRWYGPGAAQMVCPGEPKLSVACGEIRRAPALRYRMGTPTFDWPIMKAQWDNPSAEAVALYLRRLRMGGEKWAANHSFRSFHDRFAQKNPSAPDLFEGARPEFFAQGQTGDADSRQLCYTNEALVQQVAQDARRYFDGRGLKGRQVALGDYFALVPLDNSAWCKCPKCQALLAKDVGNARGGHFNSGTASHYWFSFVNAVARETARTHPGKFIATLAYHVYALRPEGLAIEPNVAVAPCLQIRNYWAPNIERHEHELLRQWTEPGDRPIHVWNYCCFPEEPGVLTGQWKCFPGFSAHRVTQEIARYHRDGVRGVFLCGVGEQLDFYLTIKLQDDPAAEVDALLAEFFERYFGAAAAPMRAFYRVIEETFTGPRNYPADLISAETQLHQTEYLAWQVLGTEARMTELGHLIQQAEKLAGTHDEKARVGLWKTAVWLHMLDGRRDYLAKVRTGTSHH